MTDQADQQQDGPLIGVTGATGRLGGRVASLLSERGLRTRLLVRDADRAPDLPRAEVAVASFEDTDAVEEALAGVDVVLMVSAHEAEDRLDVHRGFIDAAVRAGVGHLVYTSFAGAAPHAVFTYGRTHHATEQHLIDTGIGHTVLRNNFYLEILPDLVVDSELKGPAGKGCVAAVSIEDVAEAAVEVLVDHESHVGECYDLCGPAALSLEEVAARLSALGDTVTYVEEPLEAAYAWRRESGAPEWQVEGWVSTYTAIAAGEVAGVGTGVRALTGHPPRTLEEALGGSAD
ncbi:SDR family oxidoreductase [Nocardioidaceae bacterium]|nr:SDR family oxidoreductase [Nocardioidaceae bacterium]